MEPWSVFYKIEKGAMLWQENTGQSVKFKGHAMKESNLKKTLALPDMEAWSVFYKIEKRC